MNSFAGYKETEIDWISEIPVDWSISRSKFLFKNKSLKNFPDEPLLSVTQFDGVVVRSDSNMNVWNPEGDVSGYKLIEPGDFVISLRSFEGGLELSDLRGLVSPAYTVLQPIKNIDHRYFRWLMKSYQFITELNKHVTGIRQGKNIGWDDFSNIYLTTPPSDEQKLISLFLDKKTEQIDRLVEKIQKKIKLLKEQQTSLINQCVTKGLDPNVKMKYSGIEWIGKIPKHWNCVRVKNLVSTKITDGPHETPEFVDTGIPFLSVEGVVDNQIDFKRVRGFISKETHDVYSKKCKPQKDDVLLVKSGSTTGKSTIVDTDLEFNIWSPLCILRSNTKKILPSFLFNSVQSSYFTTQIETGWSYGTQPNIGMGVIENLWISLPSIEEQKIINLRLMDVVKPIDVNVQKNNEKIELLKEYRQSLISSAVTGKVRVTEDMI